MIGVDVSMRKKLFSQISERVPLLRSSETTSQIGINKNCTKKKIVFVVN